MIIQCVNVFAHLSNKVQMKFKPKEVMVNLPTVLTFQSEDEIVQMASAFNTFIHGKVKMKYEVLGVLGGQHVGLFYIQRNNESQQLRDEFVDAINQEEESAHAAKSTPPSELPDFDESDDDEEDEEREDNTPDPFKVDFRKMHGDRFRRNGY